MRDRCKVCKGEIVLMCRRGTGTCTERCERLFDSHVCDLTCFAEKDGMIDIVCMKAEK